MCQCDGGLGIHFKTKLQDKLRNSSIMYDKVYRLTIPTFSIEPNANKHLKVIL